MKVKFICSCRGDGRSYIQLSLKGIASDDSLLLESTTDLDRFVPSHLVVLEESSDCREIVIVVPQVECAINLKLSEISADGDERASFLYKIRPTVLKWKSRANYRMRPKKAFAIRDIDEKDWFDRAFFVLNECIPMNSGTLLRMTLSTSSSNIDPSMISLYDECLNPLSENVIITSETALPPSPDFPKAVVFTSFSVAVPSARTSYIIAFHNEDDEKQDGFCVIGAGHICSFLETNRELTLNASQDGAYNDWFLKNRVSEAAAKEQRVRRTSGSPLFSIVVPLFRTPPRLFEEMALSVLNQTYGELELVLVNIVDENESIQNDVSRIAASDRRVRVINQKENHGITLNTKAGIDASSGDYLAFLDHDDILEPNALFEYAEAIQNDPSIDVLYCDEDKLLPNGSYGDPYFKPDFSKYLLREINYVCHFLSIRKTIADSLCLSDPQFDGAQDHNLVLQASDADCTFHHVPKILYHWRITSTSTASGAGQKSYANQAGKRAVQEHLHRLGVAAAVEDSEDECRYRVKYETNGAPLVSIIIPSKDNTEVLDTCIRSILDKSTYDNFEVVIIENNSAEIETFDYYREIEALDDRIRVETWEHEFNFSKLMNFGVAHSEGEYIILLNNDTEVISIDWIERLLGICQDSDVGVVGAKLYFPDGTIQHAGVGLGGEGAGHLNINLYGNTPGYFNTARTTHELSAVTAACLMTKRSVFHNVGGFSEEFAVAFNDVDYCLKVRKSGKLVVFCSHVELYHYESLSRGYETTSTKRIRFHRETALLNFHWPEYFVLGDPYLNPNIYPGNMYYRLNDKGLRP